MAKKKVGVPAKHANRTPARGLSVRHTTKADAPAPKKGFVPGLDDDDGDDFAAAKRSATRGMFRSQRGKF